MDWGSNGLCGGALLMPSRTRTGLEEARRRRRGARPGEGRRRDAALLPFVSDRRRRDPVTYAWRQWRSRTSSRPRRLRPSCRDLMKRHAHAVDEELLQRGCGDLSGNGRCRSSGRRSRGQQRGSPRLDSFCHDVQEIEAELLDKVSERSEVVGS